jgi:nitrite reductase/ring-hydroxylating ferredoxin subunit
VARTERLICASNALEEGGTGQRFECSGRAAFAIRYAGRVHGWRNRCPHALTELDWLPGEFFDSAKLYLICATHGAQFEPDTGYCIGGPCRGQRLFPVPVIERDGAVYCIEDDDG